ncbi:MAG: outer membrane protein assembly factor BamA [Thermodesulfobacteriota bacterium]|nr:outer membrane protein assembly factor BamA [Thermodesulfobacteriota bacterium]
MIYKCKKFLFILLIYLVFSPVNALSQNIKSMIILPPEIYSKSDVVYLQNQLHEKLTAELEKSPHIRIIKGDTIEKLIRNKYIDEQFAISVGEKTGADFVITGSLTRMGNLVSTDFRVVDIKNERVHTGIFAQGTGLENIGTIASQITKAILLKVLMEERIADIVFTGNRRIEDSALYNILSSTKGTLFDKKNFSEDIKAIYKMGYFRDVKASITDTPGGKVITFLLEEMPRITDIEIKGDDNIDREDIEGVIIIETKQMLDESKIKSSAENIKELYRSKGYLNADVSYKIEEDEEAVQVIFTIVENRKLRIKEISFEGNRVYTDKELKDMMDTSEWGIFSFITDSGLLDENKLNQDTSKLNAFYLNNGYINAQVGEPDIKNDKKWIYITIPVTEGKQFMVGDVNIVGDMLSAPRTELLKYLKISKKDFFDREAIVADIDYLMEICNNEGYAYANVIPQTIPHEEKQKVDVTFNIDKGSLVYINVISIMGNTRTRDKVIRRELNIIEGELYNRSNLSASYMKLNRLRYFEEINFQTEKGPREDLMDINVQIKEQPTGMFSIGAGYSAQDKAVIMTQVSQRNLFGRGQTLSLNAYLGARKTNFELSFTEPWLFDIPLWSKFDIWNMAREYDSYDLDTKGFNITLGYPLWERIIGYAGYKLTSDNVKNVLDTASVYIKEQEGDTTSSGVTLTLSRDTSNDAIFPSRGSKNKVSVEHTGTIFQGDTSFTKYLASSSWFFPLPLDSAFGIRGRIGFVHGNEGKEIPIYERFYLGGINSLRGLREVGPKDPETDDVIGGETMLNFNAEIVFPLIKDAGLRGVVFFDTGNAWESGYYLDDMRETAGFGIRWYSPMGPLRLEWGHVLDRKEDEPASRWEFTIGMFM